MELETNSSGQLLGAPITGWQPVVVPSREPMQGRFCILEPLDFESHATALWQAFSRDASGANWTYLPYGPFADFESFGQWVKAMAALEDTLFFAIVDNHSGLAVGVGSYLRIDTASGVIEVGHLHFSPLLQRQPAATEAMYLMMATVFALGYRRYEWKCNALNQPSWDAALRLGFRYEGLFRQAMVVKGRNRDTAWFSIIDSEWPALKAAYEQWLAPENFDGEGRQKASLRETRTLDTSEET